MLNNTMQSTQTKQAGFTLIELLVVIAIISLLVGIAYPSYQQYLIKSRRADAQSALMDLAIHMEHYYTENYTYATATVSNTQSPAGFYTLGITQQDERSFTLQATPQHAQTADTTCQSLTLNHTGEKGIAAGPEGDSSGDVAVCWGLY
jgi:type IV pilus assembly protein PilE